MRTGLKPIILIFIVLSFNWFIVKPWLLKYSENFESKSEALQREIQLKKWKNRNVFKELIKRGNMTIKD